MPLAPPKEIFTSPPRDRIASTWSRDQAARGSYALNHIALQPDAVMNASVKFFRLPALAMSVSDGVGQAPMSTYGATNTEPGGGGGGGGGGEAVGLVVGVGVVPPPPPHAAPLILQSVGLAEPVTMKPNVVDPPGAIVPL